MGFWQNTWSNLLGGIGAGFFFLIGYMLVQWFLQATDLVVSYNWGYDHVGGLLILHPQFDIRNRSKSRSYRLAGIVYTRNGVMQWIDNHSLMGRVLEPGSMNFDFQIAPVQDTHSFPDALTLEITIQTQNSRSFWLRGVGPGQMGRGRIRRAAFWLRDKLERGMFPME